jgi:hypothetical protein
MPERVRGFVARWFTPRGWIDPHNVRQIARTTRLLTRGEMHDLFPDCEIVTERLFGLLPKSYIAIRSD